MSRIKDFDKVDALTPLDLIPIWDQETAATKIIEYQALITQIITATSHGNIDEDAVKLILQQWFVDHPVMTPKETSDAITAATKAAVSSLGEEIDAGLAAKITARLTALGWSVAPLTTDAINQLIADYIANNNIGGDQFSQDDIQTILVNYIAANGGTLLNDWIAKYLTDHPLPAVPTQTEIEAIIYNYATAHPEVFPGAGSGGGADNTTIQAQIAAYFVAHPINAGDGLTTAGAQQIVADYITAHPPAGQYDDDDISQLITNWVANNPNAYKSGFTQTQVETIISSWLAQNPNAIKIPDNVQFNSNVRAINNDNINDDKWKGQTFYALKTAINYPSAIFKVDGGAVITDCYYTDPQTGKIGRVQYGISSEGFAYRAIPVDGTWTDWGIVDFPEIGEEQGSGVTPAEIEAAVNTYLGSHPPSGAMREATSFAALRAMQPTKDGERVWLRNYVTTPAKGRDMGFGFFVGRLASKPDDKGFVASAGTGYYWQRDIELEALHVGHFGAVIDGTTDDSPALIAMYEFLLSDTAAALNTTAYMMPIKLPAGNYFLKPMDFSTYGKAFTQTDILNAQRKVAWRLLAMNLGKTSLTNPDGSTASKWQDVDPTLGARNSEQENPNDHFATSSFGITGPRVPFGRQAMVNIKSDKANDTSVFLLNSRITYVHGINFDGQITQRVAYGGNGASDGSTAPSNNQNFIKNYCWAGQYWNVSSCKMQYVGGHSFMPRDSLDARFEQMYSSMCWGSIVYSGWTNAVDGNWDHATALELNNCNFQQHMGKTPVYMVRMGQALIRNVWIEHSLCPLDITDCQVTIDTLCVESSIYPVHAYGARVVMTGYSNPTGVLFDTVTPPYITQDGVSVDNPAWRSYNLFPDGQKITVKNSGYESGTMRMECFGVEMTGSLEAGWYQSGRTCNPFATEKWIKIGYLAAKPKDNAMIKRMLTDGGSPDTVAATQAAFAYGSSAEIKILCPRPVAVSDGKDPLASTEPGVVIVKLNQWAQGNTPKFVASWHVQGDSPISDIAVTGYQTGCDVWACVPAQTKEIGYFVTCGGVTHFNAGENTLWKDGAGANLPVVRNSTTQVASAPTGTNSGIALQKWAVSLKKAAIGLTNDGRLALKTVAPTKIPTSTATPIGWFSVYVDGVERAVPYFALPA